MSSDELEPAEQLPAAGTMLLGGTFAIYTARGGGLALVTDVEGRGREQRNIPAAMVGALQGKGMMGAAFRKMFGGDPPIEDKP